MRANIMSQDYIELTTVETQYRGPHGDPLLESTTTFGDPKPEPDTGGTTTGDAANMSRDEVEKLPLWQAVKLYPKVVAYCLVLSSIFLGSGYDSIIVGSITGVDSFLQDFGYRFDGELIVPAVWYSLWLGLPPAGMALGSLTGGELQDRIGRKPTLLLGSLLSAAAVAVIFFSHVAPTGDGRRATFTAGMTLQGYSVGIIKNTVLTYVSENAPAAIRGSAMALLPTCSLLGQLVGALTLYGINDVKGKSGYLTVFGSQWIFSFAAAVVSVVMPDSPAYYLKREQPVKAARSATRLFAPRVDPRAELAKIDEALREEQATMRGSSYLSCLRGPHLRRTLIVAFVNMLPAFFGLDLLGNASTFLKILGMDSGHALLVLILGIVIGITGNATGIWVLTRVGRRPATLWTMGAAGVFWAGLGVTGSFSGSSVPYVSAGAMMAVIAACGLGCWPASYAVMGEASSLRLRSRTQALGGVASQVSTVVMSLILPYLFNPDAADLGGRTGFVYAGLCTVAVVLAFLWLPEMKGRSALEIDLMFQEGLPARRFRTWKMPAQEETVAGPDDV
ncbi:hypothetical protein N3K66_004404 [Trichothecium roseum]|uniref:Uncharacterized protein n=1 Tax=Trichothecium roseum TaxID=47278 RepID=A0ACC0V197_9HYPO|nr:hypothetical protein N3K66_004404 [Trichothecium roseum]